jgi:hypothetical protein
MRARAVLIGLGLFAAALGGASPAAAQPSETAVKAAFLTKFAGYVEWPTNFHLPSGAPASVCIVGADPFGRTIDDAARGQQVDGHPLTVKRYPGADGTDGCQVAFVQGNGAHGTADMLKALSGKPILTVTDGRAGPQRGMIHFVVADGRVRFHIDQAAAARCGLQLSARLLAVALSVKEVR